MAKQCGPSIAIGDFKGIQGRKEEIDPRRLKSEQSNEFPAHRHVGFKELQAIGLYMGKKFLDK